MTGSRCVSAYPQFPLALRHQWGKLANTGSNSAAAHICAPGQRRSEARENSCSLLELICHQPGHKASDVKGWRVSPNNCLALLPQAFLWGFTCAALTCCRVDYLILSCNYESLITVSAAVTQLHVAETISIQIGRQVTVYVSSVLLNNLSLSVEWLRHPLNSGIWDSIKTRQCGKSIEKLNWIWILERKNAIIHPTWDIWKISSV